MTQQESECRHKSERNLHGDRKNPSRKPLRVVVTLLEERSLMADAIMTDAPSACTVPMLQEDVFKPLGNIIDDPCSMAAVSISRGFRAIDAQGAFDPPGRWLQSRLGTESRITGSRGNS
jgi:hypothetical protein